MGRATTPARAFAGMAWTSYGCADCPRARHHRGVRCLAPVAGTSQLERRRHLADWRTVPSVRLETRAVHAARDDGGGTLDASAIRCPTLRARRHC